MGDDQDRRAQPFPELPPEEEYPEAEDGSRTGLPRRVEAWRRRSATGAILTGFALGLREVFEAPREEPAIMLETSGAPPRDLPVEADLDAVPPRQSVVRVRPWLLPEQDGSAGSRVGATGPGGEPGADGAAGEREADGAAGEPGADGAADASSAAPPEPPRSDGAGRAG